MMLHHSLPIPRPPRRPRRPRKHLTALRLASSLFVCATLIHLTFGLGFGPASAFGQAGPRPRPSLPRANASVVAKVGEIGGVERYHELIPPADKDADTTAAAEDFIEIQFDDEYGFEWCVIGDVDNVPFPGHFLWGSFKGEGSISYEYRLARVELTVLQYHEFISAYWPYYDGLPRLPEFTGSFMRGKLVDDKWVFTIDRGLEEAATDLSLRMAARYCNWLHNGKITEEWAFDTGCYDASTFTRNPDGTYNDDYTILPGARYWVPSLGEWLKGAFYDPNRYGKGEPGWWKYPNRSDQSPRFGLPNFDGSDQFDLFSTRPTLRLDGHTNAAAWLINLPKWTWAVGQYHREQSAWGLLDISGGMPDMGFPFSLGSSYFTHPDDIWFYDGAGVVYSNIEEYPTAPEGGLRIASWPE